jgi:hypothetical protein
MAPEAETPDLGESASEPASVAVSTEARSGSSSRNGEGNGSHEHQGDESSQAEGADDVEVRSVTDLAKKYGFSAPDEWVGPESSRSVLDYGRAPVVLADSSRKTDTTQRDRFWETLLKLYG